MSVFDRFRLDGRKAMITAGSRGLGLVMAKALAEAGADLVLVSKTRENLEAAKQELLATGRNIELVAADLSKPKIVETTCHEILANHRPIDILINNVGGRFHDVPVVEQELSLWHELMDLNLTSAFLCTKIIGAKMLERKRGRVINISSISAHVAFKGIEGRHYETAKAALLGFTRSVAVDWAPHGVTVNAIAPGAFLTDANRRWFRETPERRTEIEALIPMGRLGDPEEIGALALYLASDASSYMTGAVLTIDGGYTAS